MIIKEKKIVTKEIEELKSLICDVCGKSYDLTSKDSNDIYESQEFVHIGFIGGYGSVFGDEERVEIDICQNCFKQKLGEYVRIID